MTRFTRALAATSITTMIGLTASMASAGPAFEPQPDLSRRSSQEISVYACGEPCDGFLNASVFADSSGDLRLAYFSLTELAPSTKFAQCPFNPDDLIVRNDAGVATLNTTVDAADCFVSETCDEDGVCEPDYEGTITVAASARRPGNSSSSSSQTKTQYDGATSLTTCQTKEGSMYDEAAVSVNGRGWTPNYVGAANRACSGVGKSR